MLTVAPLASGQARYYLSLTSSSYYTEGPEPDGRWYGLGAKEFGLEGAVRAEDLTQLCEGYDPRDPSRHVRNAGVSEGDRIRKHGDDLCFSPPKSLSVLWMLASDDVRASIERAIHRAVRDALDYVQAECGWSRVGAQGQKIERVPLTFALFEHCSSRLGDPQLHVHAVCPNLTLRTNAWGKEVVTAIDSTHFYFHQMTAGALFRASLAEYVRELGFSVERVGFAFRIKGISEEICERFSQRRAEIEQGILEAAKFVGNLDSLDAREVLVAARGRMAEIVNLETRRGKKEYTRAELFPIWRDIARSVGMDEHLVAKLVNQPKKLTPDQKFLLKEEIFRDALRAMTEEFSHFSEKDLVRKVAEEAQGKGLSARDVRELVDSKIAQKEVLRLGELVVHGKNEKRRDFRERSEARYTTEEILTLENSMLASAFRMAKQSAAVPRRLVEQAIETKEKFSAEQAEAVRHLVAGNGRIACMTGKAGTGKSTTLDGCRLAWELAGRRVIGCALAGVAADELHRSSGIESDTLARTLFRLQNGHLELTPNHVVVLDEAAMVPTKLMAALIHQVERAGAKLVLVGDADQLQSVGGAGGPFRSIAQRIGQCVLSEIRRQRERWRRDTVEQFSRGEAKEALIAYATKGQLHVTETRDEALAGLVERWKSDRGVSNPKDVLLLASLNAEVRAINRMCQEERKQANQLGERKLFADGDFIYEGDRVMLGKNSRPLGVKNGFTGLVTGVDEESGRMKVMLDVDDREVVVSLEDYGAKSIKLGYASSVHKAQGRTIEYCHCLMGSHMDSLHLAYVQASRSRESTHLFLDRAHAGPGMRDAIRTLSRARHKDLARDIIDRPYEAARLAEEARLAQERARMHPRRNELSMGL